MKATDIIDLGFSHLGKGGMTSSAKLCLYDALKANDKGNEKAAKMWALKSLAYSVGIGHADYIRASE